MTGSNKSFKQTQTNCDELFEKALEKAKIDSQSHSDSNSKKILILLLEKGIEHSDNDKMAENLAEIGIPEKYYKKPSQSICARMCSMLYNAMGLVESGSQTADKKSEIICR